MTNITRTRYREERTLVRGLQRLPNQDKAEFKRNVVILRRHFEQFNLDVSELCQWMVSFRPQSPNGRCDTRLFWEFLLEPERFMPENCEQVPDWLRHSVVEVGAGWKSVDILNALALDESLQKSIMAASARNQTKTTQALFLRLKPLDNGRVMILLKAAAEWLGARYVRQMENWRRNCEEWRKEKDQWEKDHPEITPELRGKYNAILQEMGIRIKRPRICTWEQLNKNLDNCQWAGERVKVKGKRASHSSLCVKYNKFHRQLRNASNRYFFQNAGKYLNIRKDKRDLTRHQAMNVLFRAIPQARPWFPETWQGYLDSLGIQERTILVDYSYQLPHCEKLTVECRFNRHTADCIKYKELVSQKLTEDERKLEEKYREWRACYLVAPGKPSLRYPSGRGLPTPKLFGRGYFELDLDRHELRLRLDDMPQGEWVAFGIKPWPRKYDYRPGDISVSSAHIHFLGTRARVGLRFKVEHKDSLFKTSQDEIDYLRSREYPRASLDNDFLQAVRKRLLDDLSKEQQENLRIMAVDLGTNKGAAAFFKGQDYDKSELLKIRKLDVLSESGPDSKKLDKKEKEALKTRGLTGGHIGKHLVMLEKKSAEIVRHRQGEGQDSADQAIGEHDLIHLTTHIRRMIRDWVRLNTAQIMKLAIGYHANLIVMESMREFRVPGYNSLDMDKKRRLAFFAFGAIRRKTKEKAVEKGMRVVTLPYKGSSQVCGNCGGQIADKSDWIKNKKQGKFICKTCKYECDSDVNAARVLGRVFWGEIVLK